jgi:hypothetical protein
MPLTIRSRRAFLLLVYISGFLSLATLLPSGKPVYAEWVEVGGKVEEGLTVYLELDTLSRSGGVVKFWELWDFKSTRTEPKPPHLSVKSQREFDCTNKRGQLLAVTAFSGNMGSGKVVYSYSEFNDQGISVEPGSVAESVWKVVCGKK